MIIRLNGCALHRENQGEDLMVQRVVEGRFQLPLLLTQAA